MYRLHSIVLNTTTDVHLQDVESHDFDAAITKFVGSAAGNISPTFAAVMGSNPVYNFNARQLKIALDEIGMSGYALSDNGTPTKVFEAYIAKMDDKGGLSSSGHHVVTVSNGIIVPQTLNLTHGDSPDALQCQVIGQVKAADNSSPISHTSGATLPTLPNWEHEGFTLGPVKYNGTTAIAQVQSVDITFGIEVDAVRGDGHIWPVATYIMRKVPKITVTTNDMESARLIGGSSQIGTAATGSLVVYARKLSETLGRELDATTAHISFTATDWHAHVTGGMGGNEGERPVPQIEFTPLDTSAPLVINTATAIT